ncbi:MAG: M23 family metallopeptidase [Rhodoferax sp.]|nr:M23 family metallopeptidase [Rhodoferax sp.]
MTYFVTSKMSRWLDRVASSLQRHPRRVSAAIGALLLGTGVTAFSIAPGSSSVVGMPVKQIVQVVTPISNAIQGNQEAAASFVLYRNEITRRTDSVSSLLRRLGVSDSAAANFLIRDTVSLNLLAGSPGKLVTTETDDRHQLQRLTALWLNDDGVQFSRLIVELSGLGFTSKMEMGPLDRSVRSASGKVRGSSMAATNDARLPVSIATQLADLFLTVPSVRGGPLVGDSFSVVYETFEVDGEVLGSGKLLGAEFVTNGQRHQAMWFQEAGRKGGYYTMDGQLLSNELMVSPLKSARVSSGYGMRTPPTLGASKAHMGVDVVSPAGTPVRSAADGRVIFAGWKAGYGQFVVVEHRDQKTTAYAHLSQIQVRKGLRMLQRDLIGAVGQTGIATGPNLHFEYTVKGRQQDRSVILRTHEQQSSLANRSEFNRLYQTILAQLDAASVVVQASAN